MTGKKIEPISKEKFALLCKLQRIYSILKSESKTQINVQYLVSAVVYEMFLCTLINISIPTNIENDVKVYVKLIRDSKRELFLFICRMFVRLTYEKIKGTNKFEEFYTFLGIFLAKLDFDLPADDDDDDDDKRRRKQFYFYSYSYEEMNSALLEQLSFEASLTNKDNFEVGYSSTDKFPDVYFLTLKQLQAALSSNDIASSMCFHTVDEIFFEVGKIEGSRDDRLSVFAQITFPLVGSYKDGDKTLEDHETSKSLFEAVVNALLEHKLPDADYHRFDTLIVDIKELVKCCKRNSRKFVGETYRPLQLTDRGYRYTSNLSVGDENEQREKWACQNLAMILVLNASYGIRNLATNNLERLIFHWTRVIVPKYTDDANITANASTEMNLLTDGNKANGKAEDKFTELFLSLMVYSYNADPNLERLNVRAGTNLGLTQTFNAKYSQMLKNDMLPSFDPYQLLSGGTVTDVKFSEKTVFQICIYGYPENLSNPFYTLAGSLPTSASTATSDSTTTAVSTEEASSTPTAAASALKSLALVF